jgi:hypothetical protein
VIAWFPAALLTIVFVLTFFPWVGSFAGGSSVYWQEPWRAAIGSVGRNFAVEKAIAIPTNWLNNVHSDWYLMIPYLLFLIIGLIVVWAERLAHWFDPRRLPPLRKIWPYIQSIIGALLLVLFILSLVQIANGFGMERAIRKTVSDQFAERREEAAKKQDESVLASINYEADMTYNSYNIERTTWLYLALLCNLLAILAMALVLVLERRGNKPAPKLLLHY